MAGGGRQAEADGRRVTGERRKTNNERKRKVAGSKPPPTTGGETRNENRPKRPDPGQKPAKKKTGNGP